MLLNEAAVLTIKGLENKTTISELFDVLDNAESQLRFTDEDVRNIQKVQYRLGVLIKMFNSETSQLYADLATGRIKTPLNGIYKRRIQTYCQLDIREPGWGDIRMADCMLHTLESENLIHSENLNQARQILGQVK